MKRNGASRARRRGARIVVAALAAFVVSAVAPAVAAAQTCVLPSVLPVSELREGMTGTGYTVVKGRTPVSFKVEILGVLPDGIAPGIDFVLVKTSGRVIEGTGGIAFGMSGSPVYVEGRLAGAISHGFFAADQTIGGMTPIEPMLDVLGYPSLLASTSAALARTSSVRLTAQLERAAAEAAGVSTAEIPAVAKQLLVPVAVSGLNGRGMDRLTEYMERSSLPFVPYRAGRAEAVTNPSAGPLGAGAAVGAAASYGDLTFAGVGTLTATVPCGSELRSVAFGHPFFFDGPSALGWSAADVLTVVPDPSNLIGPFKVANLAELRGTVDQDRWAAIRAVEGVLPELAPVTSNVANPDVGRSRAGRTDVARQDFMPFVTAFHLLLNQDAVFDRIGDGSSDVSWTIRGTRESGVPFELSRRNMYYSPWDISFESIFELWFHLELIQQNQFESVRITDVELDSEITQENRTATIKRVLSASSLQPALRERKTLRARRGDTIRLRVFLLPASSTVERPVDLALELPRRGGQRFLEIRGGSAFEGCFFCEEGEDGESPSGPASFDELLAELANADHNFDLVARLRDRGTTRKAVSAQPEIVLGRRTLTVFVVR